MMPNEKGKKAFGEPDFKRLFEALPGLFLVLDPDLYILAASDAYLQATLTRREEILGRFLFDIFPDNPDDPSADSIRNTRASLNRVLQNRVTDTMVVQRHDVRRPESEGGGFEVRYWSPVNSPVLNPDGSVAYIIHRVENVTDFVLLKERGLEQAKLTDELREQAVRMEADLYSRSREVAESSLKLKQANEELARLYEKTRELDELKTQFFANVSHELRTPLALILGPVDRLLKGSNVGDEARRDLLVVQRNARLLQRHVNDLLDIAKLEAGRMSIQYARTDLAKLIRLSASHFETMATDRHIRFEVHTPETQLAEVDGEKVEHMLLNLLSNAFKFTPDGGMVMISSEKCGERVLIHVQDTGPGVPEHLRDAIFERFRQGEGGVERHHGGTGLGLAIVREFATLHGGSAGVTRSPGGGALFTLDLPLKAPAGTQVADESTTTTGGAAEQTLDELRQQPDFSQSVQPPSDVEAPHILIVEDNPDMNDFLANALGRHYWISRAFDGREGLKKALADPPDLILSDVMMAGMGGDRMVEELRRHRALDDVPIVMLTAKADDALRVKLLRHGVQDYLHKPFSVEEVRARVDSLLAERSRTGKRLRQSEERFRATFEQAAVGIAHVAPDGRWLRVNQRLCDITGYSRQELLARSFQDITHPEDLNSDLEQVHRLLAGEISHYSLEKRYVRKDGGAIWINLTVALVRDENDAPDYFIAVVEDIRRRKEAEAEIRRLNADLERRVEERTTELRAANQELENFTGAVSHDLRAPLRAINGFSRILLERYGNQFAEEANRYLNEIVNASRKMGDLIEGLLTLSRSLRGELNREQVDASSLAMGIIAQLAAAEPDRQVNWEIESGLTVYGDPRLMEAVMQNLLSNAWKYSCKAAHSRISVKACEDSGQRWICVADNGAGFDPAYADKLFQPFKRLHSQNDFPGIGIGLATVQRIIQRHGGQIRANASPGAGATFCFTLPDTISAEK